MYGKTIGMRFLAVVALLPLLAQVTGSPVTGPDPIDTTLRFDKLAVYKYEGFQPYDVVARVVDGNGQPVDGADVKVVFAATGKTAIPLKSTGKGNYIGCDLEWIDAPSGDLTIRVVAQKRGMLTAEATVKDQPGNGCGAGEPQLYISKIDADKLNGSKKSLDVALRVTDERGLPVKGAEVMIRATDYHNYVDARLADAGDGKYMACSLGSFDTSGAGQIVIHARASALGYREAEADSVNKVGTICSRQAPPSDDTTTGSTTQATARGDGRFAR